MDSGSYRSQRDNQAALIAHELGHYHVFESKYEPLSPIQMLPVVNKQVNAFLTSQEIKDKHFHYFNKGIKRLVIELILNDLNIFLVHLSLKHRHRHDQLADLYSLVKEVEKPVIVAGDFNPRWGDREIRLFLAATGLRNANVQGLPSHPSWDPRRELDIILYSPEIRVTRFEIPGVDYSDHLPLVCDFEVAPAD